MQILVPDMQPIRFYKPLETPDWQTYFPNPDNITHREKWIGNLHPVNYYTDWLINKEISFQFQLTVPGTEDIEIYKIDSAGAYQLYDTISPVEITPSGWVSYKVNRYDFTPTEAGVYYFYSASAGYRSDKFVVVESLKFRKRLLEIVYYNTENDYGMVFFDGVTQRYTGRAYFTGVLYPETPGNKVSAFVTDRGNLSKQRSTPVKMAMLKIVDIHYAELDRVNLILSCDRLTINGITYQNDEGPESEGIDGTDLVKITVKLSQTNYNYFKS